MNHKQKVKLAHRLRTHKELKAGISIWDTEGWLLHKQKIQREVAKREANAQRASFLRKQREKEREE